MIRTGTRVTTTRLLDVWSDVRYAGQSGVVIGFIQSLVQVRMDDPSLHDRNYAGQDCAAYQAENLTIDDHVIEEEPSLGD